MGLFKSVPFYWSWRKVVWLYRLDVRFDEYSVGTNFETQKLIHMIVPSFHFETQKLTSHDLLIRLC